MAVNRDIVESMSMTLVLYVEGSLLLTRWDHTRTLITSVGTASWGTGK